jgi:hypothetical protein
MDISTIKQNPSNPRTITREQFALLVESIKRDPEFLRVRQVAHASGFAYGGNQRLEAVRECLKDTTFCEAHGITGANTVPDAWFVDVSDWPADKIARFVIVDNAPRGMSGDWDWDTLGNEWDDELLAGLGMEIPEVDMEAQGGGEEEKQDNTISFTVCPKCGHQFEG